VVGWSTSGPTLGSIFNVEAPTARAALELGLDAFDTGLDAAGVDVPIRRVELAPESFEDDHLLGAVEGARLLGVSRQRFYQLQKKPGFPAPAAGLARGALWRRADIEAFGASRSRRIAG
jgi:predicted DNA-binding transcriptional regulator AlpA